MAEEIPPHDLDGLRKLKDRFEKITDPPGLFHVTRIRFAAVACDPAELGKGWEEFLGDETPFEFHSSETRAGPAWQQGCYFGAREKMKDYTELAAIAPGQLPLGSIPITFHHRNARIDRDQWTLGLYAAAAQLDWDVPFDSLGTGTYARLDIDSKDALSVFSGSWEAKEISHFLQGVERSLKQNRRKSPRFIYGALAADLFSASCRCIGLHIRRLQSQVSRPVPTISYLSLTAWQPASNKANGCPDDGWQFRNGGYAFLGVKRDFSGVPLKLLTRTRQQPVSSQSRTASRTGVGWHGAN